jgi:hypothetical protein
MKLVNSAFVEAHSTPDLPFDFQPFVPHRGEEHGGAIPWVYCNHMWKYGLVEEEFYLYNVGWSKTWQRVIIPLYEYTFAGELPTRKLVGWVGRDPTWTKTHAAPDHPKWLTRAQRGARRYFMAPGDDPKGPVVLVEDAISAIKVWKATDYTSIALLTTSVSNELMRKLRDRKIYLWLDPDQLANSVKIVCRMQELGLDAHNVHTTKDPKDYNELAIRVHLRVTDKEEEEELSAATKFAMGVGNLPEKEITDGEFAIEGD